MAKTAPYRPGTTAVTPQIRPTVGLLDLLTRGMILLNLFISVVFPHSFQLVSAGVLGVTTVFCLLSLKYSAYFDRLVPIYLLGAFVSAFYIWVGFTNRAPIESVLQNTAVYIVSPFAWLIIGTATFQQLGITRVVRIMIWLSILAVLSVALFFFLFLTFGADAVSILVDDANVNVQDGYAGATILVYGSLIFLTGAIFAEPNVIKNKFARVIVPGLMVIAALTSGRSALILAVPVGFLFGTFVRSRTEAFGNARDRQPFLVPTLMLGLVMLAVVIVIDVLVDRIDLSVILGEFISEVQSGGGDLRTEQVFALLEGIMDTYGLGAGHGIGVDYLRSTEFPWRYEVIPLATLYRVGVIGTCVYAAIFVVYGLNFTRHLRAGSLREEDVFMAGGFVCAFLGIFTNPYIESFIFQWMYLLPILSLGVVQLPPSGPRR